MDHSIHFIKRDLQHEKRPCILIHANPNYLNSLVSVMSSQPNGLDFDKMREICKMCRISAPLTSTRSSVRNNGFNVLDITWFCLNLIRSCLELFISSDFLSQTIEYWFYKANESNFLMDQ